MNLCEHRDFTASVQVNRLSDSGQFQADVRITCAQCATPFGFVGVPFGLNLHGVAQGLDGEGRFAIRPLPLDGQGRVQLAEGG